MLIRISDDTSINPEYIINLYLRDRPRAEGDPIYKDKYSVVARMIDGTLLELYKKETKEDAEISYNLFLELANVHLTKEV